MATAIITFDFVQDLFESKDPFPVDFEEAWRWLGYTRKSSAKKMLTTNFEKGEDFCIKEGFCSKRCKTPAGGRPEEKIYLTVGCFKELGMLAQTPQGKLVRKYYLECERVANQVIRKQLVRLNELEEDQRAREEYRKSIDSLSPTETAKRLIGLATLANVLADAAVLEECRIYDKEIYGN
jgi:anti-repressor protein